MRAALIILLFPILTYGQYPTTIGYNEEGIEASALMSSEYEHEMVGLGFYILRRSHFVSVNVLAGFNRSGFINDNARPQFAGDFGIRGGSLNYRYRYFKIKDRGSLNVFGQANYVRYNGQTDYYLSELPSSMYDETRQSIDLLVGPGLDYPLGKMLMFYVQAGAGAMIYNTSVTHSPQTLFT